MQRIKMKDGRTMRGNPPSYNMKRTVGFAKIIKSVL